MNNHTPEPWMIRDGEHNRSSTDICTGPCGGLLYVSTAGARGRTLDEARANAERIVACVNFCAGAPIKVLKPGLLVLSFRPLADGTCVDVLTQDKEIRRLKAENARLQAGQFTAEEFQNLCHTQATMESRPQTFCDGCEEYHKKIFGWSPITKLKERVRQLEEDLRTATKTAMES